MHNQVNLSCFSLASVHLVILKRHVNQDLKVDVLTIILKDDYLVALEICASNISNRVKIMRNNLRQVCSTFKWYSVFGHYIVYNDLH